MFNPRQKEGLSVATLVAQLNNPSVHSISCLKRIFINQYVKSNGYQYTESDFGRSDSQLRNYDFIYKIAADIISYSEISDARTAKLLKKVLDIELAAVLTASYGISREIRSISPADKTSLIDLCTGKEERKGALDLLQSYETAPTKSKTTIKKRKKLPSPFPTKPISSFFGAVAAAAPAPVVLESPASAKPSAASAPANPSFAPAVRPLRNITSFFTKQQAQVQVAADVEVVDLTYESDEDPSSQDAPHKKSRGDTRASTPDSTISGFSTSPTRPKGLFLLDKAAVPAAASDSGASSSRSIPSPANTSTSVSLAGSDEEDSNTKWKNIQSRKQQQQLSWREKEAARAAVAEVSAEERSSHL